MGAILKLVKLNSLVQAQLDDERAYLRGETTADAVLQRTSQRLRDGVLVVGELLGDVGKNGLAGV